MAGTLTENRMTVVAGWFAGRFWPSVPPLEELPEPLRTEVELNSALNSKVHALSILLSPLCLKKCNLPYIGFLLHVVCEEIWSSCFCDGFWVPAGFLD